MLQRSFWFVRYMTHYGIALGCLVGFFGALALTLTLSNTATQLPQLVTMMLVAGMFGGIIGIFYGAVSGFASGLLMALVTQIAYREIRRHDVYKLVMGMVTAIATLTIFLAIPFWHSITYQALPVDPMFAGIGDRSLLMIPVEAGFSLWIMSLVFAVYASQRVATEYLRDVDVRQSKVK